MKKMLMKLALRFLPGLVPEKLRVFLRDPRVRRTLAVVVAALAAMRSQLPEYAEAIDLAVEALGALGLTVLATMPKPPEPQLVAVAGTNLTASSDPGEGSHGG